MTNEQTEGRRERDSNLELFRILVMLAIIAHHFVVNSGLTDRPGLIYDDIFSFRSVFLLLFGAWGKTGINCFVLITGYFMCRSEITLRKFLKLLLEVEFYRIVIYLIFVLTGAELFSLGGFLDAVIPVRSIGSGFVAAYLVFFLFIPFLNVLVRNLTEKQHLLLLLLVSFLYVFLATVPWFAVTYNYVSWFICLYLFASFIRLHPRPLFERTGLWGLITAGLFLLASVSIVLLCFLWSRGMEYYPLYPVKDSNVGFSLPLGLSAFLFFKNLKLPQSRVINCLASSCFGVLLIHANGEGMRTFLWKELLAVTERCAGSGWLPFALLSVPAIFLVCFLLDQLRQLVLERPLFRLFDKLTMRK